MGADTLISVAQRFDAIRLDVAKALPRKGSGAVVVPALITRSGVFPYQDSNGKTVYEWRPPEEVTKADSVAAFQGLPLTDRHPKTFVSADNWKTLSIGHLEDPRVDATTQGVLANLVVADGSKISKVGKDLLEASCGYGCKIDETSGVVPEGMPDAGKRYDRIQRDIVPNHTALGPENWGRQGPTVAMRLDGADDQIAPDVREDNTTEQHTMFEIRFDGILFTGATSAEVQAKVDSHIAAKGTSDLATQLTKAQTEAAEAKGRADAAEKQAKAEKERADAAPAQARKDIEARIVLETDARKVLGAAEKFDGKTDREIKVLVIKHFDSTFSDVEKVDGKDVPKHDAEIKGSFETWTKAGPTRNDGGTNRIALGLNGADGGGHSRKDGSQEERIDEHDPDAARKRRDDRVTGNRQDGGADKKYVNGQEVKFQG